MLKNRLQTEAYIHQPPISTQYVEKSSQSRKEEKLLGNFKHIYLVMRSKRLIISSRAGGVGKVKEVLTYIIFQVLWCKYVHHGCFQATSGCH